MLSGRPMYSARTLLVPVLLMGGPNGSDISSAQIHFPAVRVLGGGWESTLMVQALAGNTACTFFSTGPIFYDRESFR